jgi:tetratricopeptide (TPR) repeat protein
MARLLAALLLSICVLAAQDDLIKDGNTAYLRGDYEAARIAFTRAWELMQQTPKDDPQRYEILKRLTSVRAAAGEFADADLWLQQAITWREQILGVRDPKIADDLLISVGLYRGLKDFDRALAILQRVRVMHSQEYTAASVQLGGPLDPSMIVDLDRLGDYQIALRAYDQAEEAYRHVLVIRETLYGKHHADLIATVDGLAYSLFGQKKYDAAEPVYQRLLELWEGSVGKDHAMVAVALDKIAVFYSTQKKYPEAATALARSTAIRGRFLAMGFSQQATEAFVEGHKDQAKMYYQRGLAALEPLDPMNDDLREQFQGMIAALDAPPPKSATPPKKAATPPKKTGKQ